MVNKYIAVITVVNEMGDTNVSVARMYNVGVYLHVRHGMLVFILCLTDAYTIYQCYTETSIRLIQI